MKSILIICLTFLFIPSIFSQEDDVKVTRSELGISAGMAIPVGRFADDNVARSSAGLASKGYLVQLQYGYKFSEFFGTTALVRHQNHNVDPQLLASAIPSSPNVYASASTTNWKINSYMLGVFAALPLRAQQDLYLDFQFLAGITSSISPSASLSVRENGYSETFRQASKSKRFLFFGRSGIKILPNP